MSWDQLESLFLEVLELPPDERGERLRAESDEALRIEVQAMLEAHEGDELSIESRLLAPTEPQDLAGQRVGPYRLLESIGSGGMGEVYLARRDDDLYERDVAIKLVHHGPRPSLRERFAREQSILARLTHPNVATLYDGGVHEDGRPYLVMEYVEGLPITEYCDQHRLGIQERIELFMKVCEAVQFAHGSLIIHRDLKASNILVDATGAPKLLDFGIAKLLEDDDSETIALDRVLTPEHAAPEQIRGEDPTTATDVYGLGVLLCELLAGARPIKFPTRSPMEIDRIAREVEPLPPSKLVDPDQADRRGTTAEALTEHLKGDLDSICAKALRKEPEQRYPSPAELQADLSRHLRSRPVRAVDGNRAYYARKFIRRYRTSLTLGAIALLVLASFLTVALIQAGQVRTERDRARQEFARAQLVLDQLVSLFEETQPRAPGEEDPMDVSEFLRRGEETATFLDGEPEAQARMYQILAEIYASRGNLERAIELTTRARDLTDDEREQLGLNHEVATLRNRREGPEVGIPLLRESYARQLALLGPEDAQTVQARLDLGVVLQDSAEARPLIEESLASRTDPDPARAAALNALAQIEIVETRFPEARAHLEEADAILANTLPQTANSRMAVRHNLSAVYARLGMWDEAEPIQRSIVETRRQLYGEDSDLVANSLEGLAVTLANQGRHRESGEAFAEALAIFERTLAPGHWRIANGERNVGQLLSLQARYDEALPHFDRCIEFGGSLARPTAHQRAQRALVWLGLGRTGEALADLQGIRREMDEPDSGFASAYRADVQIWLGIALIHSERAADAREWFEEARNLRGQVFPASHPKMDEATAGIAAAGGPVDPEAISRYRRWGLAHPLMLELIAP